MSILDDIASKACERVREQRAIAPLEELEHDAMAIVRAEIDDRSFGRFPFEQALKGDGFGFICEVKKASPSKGIIEPDFRPIETAIEYQEAGANAISCLTEPYWFLGSDDYLREISQTVSIPVLRKDFVVDEYMVYQAKLLGASAILLICAILDDEQLSSFFSLADSLGLSALVEAHDAVEVERAVSVGARVIGVNNRNLKDFSVDLGNASSLRSCVPHGITFVAESGVRGPEDIATLASQGIDAALVGEALMRIDDKAALISEMRSAAGNAR